MALPHYLTSGASSRAHYALLRKLDAAGTLHDADEAIRDEVARCKGVLEGNVSLATGDRGVLRVILSRGVIPPPLSRLNSVLEENEWPGRPGDPTDCAQLEDWKEEAAHACLVS